MPASWAILISSNGEVIHVLYVVKFTTQANPPTLSQPKVFWAIRAKVGLTEIAEGNIVFLEYSVYCICMLALPQMAYLNIISPAFHAWSAFLNLQMTIAQGTH